MMSWIDLLDDNHFLKTLFPKEAPTLQAVRVHRVQLHQDGPALIVDFDLNDYPTSPPLKWLSGYNTVQIRLIGIDLRELKIRGWSTNNIGRLDLTRNGGRTVARLSTPECSLHAELARIRVDKVSAYQNFTAQQT